jgi:hypothetical protein
VEERMNVFLRCVNNYQKKWQNAKKKPMWSTTLTGLEASDSALRLMEMVEMGLAAMPLAVLAAPATRTILNILKWKQKEFKQIYFIDPSIKLHFLAIPREKCKTKA